VRTLILLRPQREPRGLQLGLGLPVPRRNRTR